jgi:predicted ATPase
MPKPVVARTTTLNQVDRRIRALKERQKQLEARINQLEEVRTDFGGDLSVQESARPTLPARQRIRITEVVDNAREMVTSIEDSLKRIEQLVSQLKAALDAVENVKTLLNGRGSGDNQPDPLRIAPEADKREDEPPPPSTGDKAMPDLGQLLKLASSPVFQELLKGMLSGANSGGDK